MDKEEHGVIEGWKLLNAFHSGEIDDPSNTQLRKIMRALNLPVSVDGRYLGKTQLLHTVMQKQSYEYLKERMYQ